jgi:A/G-specific adenine glycosylase
LFVYCVCVFIFFVVEVEFSWVDQLQKSILTWYSSHKRFLPWRETCDPYAIHISEVMSQQTQVERVIPYWTRWMQNIPDYWSLASLSKLELLSYWSWLWFNSRALRLQECAQLVVEKYNGELPWNIDLLLELPWIWPYTAWAICSFAWNLPEVVIDTNIRRVLIFLLKLPEDISYDELSMIAKRLIPEWRSRDWHNALMDYWAMYLTARKTRIKSLGKQSKFEWSDREVRGWIVKQLTSGNNILELKSIQEQFPHKNIDKILEGMEKEGIVMIAHNYVKIA